MHIVLFFRYLFYLHKESFLIIKMKLRHYTTLKKTFEKTIFLYIIVSVCRGTYLGIDQRIKRKFISSAAFSGLFNFIIITETKTFSKIRL